VSVDLLDRRALAALRFVHAVSGIPVTRALSLSAPGARFVRNRSGDWALLEAPGFADYSANFDTAPAVAPTSITLAVTDPLGEFLPRRIQLSLPRNADPAQAALADSVFQPQRIALHPAPAARPEHDWARLYASVTTDAGTPAAHALLRVERTADNTLLATALADARGEALVAIAGIPLTPWDEGDGPVLGTDIEVRVSAFHDAAITAFPDPDDLTARRAGLATISAVIRVAASRAQSLALRLNP
jgi:hypothetical protein